MIVRIRDGVLKAAHVDVIGKSMKQWGPFKVGSAVLMRVPNLGQEKYFYGKIEELYDNGYAHVNWMNRDSNSSLESITELLAEHPRETPFALGDTVLRKLEPEVDSFTNRYQLNTVVATFENNLALVRDSDGVHSVERYLGSSRGIIPEIEDHQNLSKNTLIYVSFPNDPSRAWTIGKLLRTFSSDLFLFQDQKRIDPEVIQYSQIRKLCDGPLARQ